jgi:hypothetical protein
MTALAQINIITEIMCANLSAKSQRQGLLRPIATAEPQDAGPRITSRAPRTSGLCCYGHGMPNDKNKAGKGTIRLISLACGEADNQFWCHAHSSFIPLFQNQSSNNPAFNTGLSEISTFFEKFWRLFTEWRFLSV